MSVLRTAYIKFELVRPSLLDEIAENRHCVGQCARISSAVDHIEFDLVSLTFAFIFIDGLTINGFRIIVPV